MRLGAVLLLCGVLTCIVAARPASAQEPAKGSSAEPAGMTEDMLKQMLAGKTFYLRGRYLEDTLHFDAHGRLAGHSAQGSYTLCLIQIDKVHLAKRKVELTGIRYGLHFLGASPSEDPARAMDRVRITPRKKLVRISIEREQVVKPRKEKKAKEQNQSPSVQNTLLATDESGDGAAAPDSGTTTISPAHARRTLEAALDAVFAPSLDARMIDALPDFWKLYYQAAAQTDRAPGAPDVLRQSQVDRKAALLSAIEPPSNEYAQAAGVAGMALYHTVVGADGRPQQIVAGRPIGFGLDENAADAIRQAGFQPAVKDGRPVPVLLDIVVQFRIYSKRTSRTAAPETQPTGSAPSLPGPYSVNHP